MVKTTNILIPTHRKLTADEVKIILDEYSVPDLLKLPKIKIKDFAISELDVQINDVIEITRTSFAGQSKYYRVVVE